MSKEVIKPWGKYIDLERSDSLVIKEITINPFQKFSLQKHFKRKEFWYIISGIGKITLGNKMYTVGPGESFSIEIEQVHRLEAYGEGVVFMEVQQGDCSEDDILRLEDDYNRVTERR